MANSFEGGTWGCEKIRGRSFLLHFYVEVFQNLYRGYMRCPPPPLPSPLCASMFNIMQPKQFLYSEYKGSIFLAFLIIIINRFSLRRRSYSCKVFYGENADLNLTLSNRSFKTLILFEFKNLAKIPFYFQRLLGVKLTVRS